MLKGFLLHLCDRYKLQCLFILRKTFVRSLDLASGALLSWPSSKFGGWFLFGFGFGVGGGGGEGVLDTIQQHTQTQLHNKTTFELVMKTSGCYFTF